MELSSQSVNADNKHLLCSFTQRTTLSTSQTNSFGQQCEIHDTVNFAWVTYCITASRTTWLYSQHKVLVPHWVESLWFDLSHLDAPGRQHLLGAGAFLQLLPSLPEAELSLLLLLHLPWALAYQDSKHAVGVAVPWQATGRQGERLSSTQNCFYYSDVAVTAARKGLICHYNQGLGLVSPFASLAIRFFAFMTETLREKLARCEKKVW